MKRSLLGLLVLGAALAPTVGSPSAVLVHGRPAMLDGGARATSFSTNWSGYSAFQTGTTFTDVKGTWVQPSANCPSRKAQYSSFWVGIDGYNSSTVEQTGTSADCQGKNNPVYYAWYEMYPAPPVNLSMTITPGDTITAEVSASGSTFTLSITNVTTGATFTTQQTLNGAAKSSAEWVAEAPSLCFVQCRVAPLANFGTVNFSGSFTTGNGHTGSISDSAWTNDQIVMVTNHGAVKAQPSALSPDGTAFSVTWMHS
jgi:Peptidase A4 family